MFMKEPHTALFIAPSGVGKTHLALDLLESEYRGHFDFIVIICPTLAHNQMHKSRIEKLQAAQIDWAHKQQQRIAFINKQLRLE